jgi:hypothetical protein
MSIVAGPARFSPLALKQLPWQGQLNSLSSGFHCTQQQQQQQHVCGTNAAMADPSKTSLSPEFNCSKSNDSLRSRSRRASSNRISRVNLYIVWHLASCLCSYCLTLYDDIFVAGLQCKATPSPKQSKTLHRIMLMPKQDHVLLLQILMVDVRPGLGTWCQQAHSIMVAAP